MWRVGERQLKASGVQPVCSTLLVSPPTRQLLIEPALTPPLSTLPILTELFLQGNRTTS